jgi:hypothetical protein
LVHDARLTPTHHSKLIKPSKSQKPHHNFILSYHYIIIFYHSIIYHPIINMDSDNESIAEDVVIFTQSEIIYKGLRLVKFGSPRIKRARRKTNVKRFRKCFGGNPDAVLACWYDLQTTTVGGAFLEPQDRQIDKFLMALYHLRKYPTDEERERIFDLSPNWSRNWVWFILEKIRASKAQKIVWEDECEDIWVVSVDGTHCWMHEVAHPEFLLDPEYFSHLAQAQQVRDNLRTCA